MDKLYDYQIPADLEAAAAVGKRISVPFARGNRRREGMVFALGQQSSQNGLKPIDGWLDDEPVLDETALRLAAWMKKRFFCTYYDAVRAMLPAGIWLRGAAVCTLTRPGDRESAYEAAGSDEMAGKLLDLLYASGGQCVLSEAESALGSRVSSAVSLLENAGVIRCGIERRQKISDRSESVAALTVSAEEALQLSARKRRSAPQQAELLRLLSELGEADVKELRYFTGAPLQSVRALEQAGLIELRAREVFRRPELRDAGGPMLTELNSEQQTVFEGLLALLKETEPRAALLYGVTGSGKTAVYIRLITETLAMGRGALVLVPEIALTPQLMAVFYRHFGDRVAVLHSSLSVGMRYDEWKRIRSGRADVVVGTRSAVFAPLPNPGLFILDEEQEGSYLSGNAPRYHARDVAKRRCVDTGALLVLGSATPSVESMYEAQQGKLSLFRLTERYNARPLPRVTVADTRKDLKNGIGGSIGSVLRAELAENLRRGEQSILFLNRRGMSTTVTCPECGRTAACPHCSVNLTYHAANHRLMCHFCGYSEPLGDRCPVCGGILRFGGLGTQRVEAELRELFPDTEILRMDTDTVSAAHPHEELLRRFEQERIPVMVGTQMVAKGLDFENVTLVGVVNADQMLYAPDYEARERTFSLITQVVGRAGRGGKTGRAVIQTATPESEVIRCAAAQDYDAFYASEIEARRLLKTPPVLAIYAITVTGESESEVIHCAGELKNALQSAAREMDDLRILGPAPAGVLRVNNRYRYRVLLNGPASPELRALTASAIRSFSGESRWKNLVFYGDAGVQD